MQNYRDGKLIKDDEAITPEQAREKFNLINQPSKDYSSAQNSKITSVDNDQTIEREKIEKYKALSEVLGVSQIREDVDKLTQSVQYIINIQAEYKNALENHTAVLQQLSGGVQAQPATQPMGGMDLGKLKEVSESLGPILDRIWPPQQTTTSTIPGLDPQDLMKEAVEAVKDDFSIGKELRGAIKDSIRKKTVQGVVKNVLTDAAQHGP